MSVENPVRADYFQSWDTVRQAKLITTYKDDFVVRKQAYSIRQVFTIADTGLTRILFDPSLANQDIFLVPFRVGINVGPMRMTITPDITITSADTELPVSNRYGLVDIPVHKMGCFTNITGLVINSEPIEYIVGSKSTNQASGGGTTAGEEIFIFEKNKKYLLSFYNDQGSGEEMDVSLQFDWFEVPTT